LAYAPPLSWTAEERKGLANSILVEYTNLFDFWYAEHWQDYRTCGPTANCPTCPRTSACSTFPNGTVNPAVKPDPGGLLTDVDAMVTLTKPEYSGPGSWADADMLQVCNYGKGGTNAGGRNDGGMTLEEYRASYSIWAVLASPMIISADLRSLKQEHPACLEMLLNQELIDISQDKLGRAGRLVRQSTNLTAPTAAATRSTNIVEQVFVRPLHNPNSTASPPAASAASASAAATGASTVAVVLFNRAEGERNITVSWAELGLAPSGTGYSVRDVWAHNIRGADRGVFATGYTARVPAHAAAMLKIQLA